MPVITIASARRPQTFAADTIVTSAAGRQPVDHWAVGERDHAALVELEVPIGMKDV